MYRSILVPLDGSKSAEAALSIAAAIAQRAGATLELVQAHTLFEPEAPAICWGPYYDPAQDSAYKTAEQAYLEATVQRLRKEFAIEVTSAVIDGAVVDSVLEHTLAIAADLIVMTTHGRGPIGRFCLGSVADVLLRRATIPILLVHEVGQGQESKPFVGVKRILVPLDGSKLAEHVLPPAIALGRLTDAEYMLVRAVEPGFFAVDYPGTRGADQAESDRLEKRKVDAACYLEKVAANLRTESLHVETTVLECSPASAILHAASALQIDLIAIATHGHGGLKRLVLGSVADKVICGTKIPVLAFRPNCQDVAVSTS